MQMWGDDVGTRCRKCGCWMNPLDRLMLVMPDDFIRLWYSSPYWVACGSAFSEQRRWLLTFFFIKGWRGNCNGRGEININMDMWPDELCEPANSWNHQHVMWRCAPGKTTSIFVPSYVWQRWHSSFIASLRWILGPPQQWEAFYSP